ncbi:hypothetical protein OSTOST_10196 [Ostertagia ostertagi]
MTTMPPITSGSSFTVHTGNVNNYLELVTRRHKNSAAEIAAAFKHLAAQNTVCLCTFSADDVQNAVKVTLDTLKLGSLSQLIVSFPYDESTDLSDSDWMERIRPIWELMESLVNKDLVHSVGVSDLDVDRLRLLCEEAKEHKPTINHYSIDGCCTVPAELVEYAKAHDIQLLTHNDPRSCDLDTDVFDSIDKITDTGRNLTFRWAARYTIWIRSRSVMAAKGYFVQFTKK